MVVFFFFFLVCFLFPSIYQFCICTLFLFFFLNLVISRSSFCSNSVYGAILRPFDSFYPMSLFVCVCVFFFKLQFCNKITAVCFSWIESEGRNNKTFCHIVLPSMTSKNNIKHDSNHPALLACLFKNREKESVDILLFQNVFVCLCQTYHIRQSF